MLASEIKKSFFYPFKEKKIVELIVSNRVARFFFYTAYQNGEKYTKLPQNYQMTINIYKMAVIYSK
jgi:hypothetical protein